MDIRKNFFSKRMVRHLAQAAQGGHGVTIPAGVQEMWICGTKKHSRHDWDGLTFQCT